MDNNINKEIIYGDYDGTVQKGCFIEIRTWNDNNHLTIDLAKNGYHIVWNFDVKDKKYIKKIKDEIIDICDEVDETAGFPGHAEREIEDLFDERYDEWFEEEEEYIQEVRSEEEIGEYMSEAFDRVWLVRKQNLCCNLLNGVESINADIMESMLKAIDKVCNKYNINFQEPVSDWNYGYWSGILAALRWVMGEEKDFLDT